MPAQRVAGVLGGVAFALDAMHGAGLFHLDLRPSGIIVAHGDTGEDGYLVDFAAPLLGPWAPPAEYGAPELANGGRVGAAADVYSVAALAFEMLTGVSPFESGGPIPALTVEEAGHGSRSGVQLAPEIRAVVVRSLATDPAARHKSAGELIRELLLARTDGPGWVRRVARKVRDSLFPVPPPASRPPPPPEDARAHTSAPATYAPHASRPQQQPPQRERGKPTVRVAPASDAAPPSERLPSEGEERGRPTVKVTPPSE